MGYAYERKVRDHLRKTYPQLPWRYHEWISYEDDRGVGRAEPDLIAPCDDRVLVVEIKLTGCRFGHEQLEGLYVPLLAHVFHRPVRALQICRAVNSDTPGPFVADFDEFLEGHLPLATWQWLGR